MSLEPFQSLLPSLASHSTAYSLTKISVGDPALLYPGPSISIMHVLSTVIKSWEKHQFPKLRFVSVHINDDHGEVITSAIAALIRVGADKGFEIDANSRPLPTKLQFWWTVLYANFISWWHQINKSLTDLIFFNPFRIRPSCSFNHDKSNPSSLLLDRMNCRKRMFRVHMMIPPMRPSHQVHSLSIQSTSPDTANWATLYPESYTRFSFSLTAYRMLYYLHALQGCFSGIWVTSVSPGDQSSYPHHAFGIAFHSDLTAKKI